jgi:catechol 2,3-dioxygenase-like lactoylglutathione lyase family enzyme
MSWSIGVVGHISIAVTDPQKSGAWWRQTIGLQHRFDFDGGTVVGNDAIDIALFTGEPHPESLDHISFHLKSMAELHEALADLKAKDVDLEDPGDEIGPEAPGSPNMGLWFRDPDGYRWELAVLAPNVRAVPRLT